MGGWAFPEWKDGLILEGLYEKDALQLDYNQRCGAASRPRSAMEKSINDHLVCGWDHFRSSGYLPGFVGRPLCDTLARGYAHCGFSMVQVAKSIAVVGQGGC